MAHVDVSGLPPVDLWPHFVTLTGAHPATLNLAAELLQGAVRPDQQQRPAILYRDRVMSYGDLHDAVLGEAASLVALGVQPRDRVVVFLPNRPEFIIVWLAVQWVGAIGVPLPPQYRRREIVRAINDSGAAFAICTEELRPILDGSRADFDHPVTLVDVDRSRPARHTTVPEPYPTGSYDAALITYIANVDGDLRGVIHSPAELLATADSYAVEVLSLTPDDVCLAPLSCAWAYGLGALIVFPLRAGAAAVLLDWGVPVVPAIAECRATILFAVPTLYRLVLRQPDFDPLRLASLRLAVSAAERLPPEVAEEWRSRTGLELLDGLGSTELAHIFISGKPGHAERGTIGTPVRGYEARIVDAGMRELPDGREGRLAVRGPTGCRYWNDVDAQRRVVRDGWTLTGDISIRRPDGAFEHVSRADELIVSGGAKISPLEVERALLDDRDVLRARVFAVPDPVRGSVPKAMVTVRAGAERRGLPARLQAYLKSELASYKCPRQIELVERLG